jgi:hypothetical protein
MARLAPSLPASHELASQSSVTDSPPLGVMMARKTATLMEAAVWRTLPSPIKMGMASCEPQMRTSHCFEPQREQQSLAASLPPTMHL